MSGGEARRAAPADGEDERLDARERRMDALFYWIAPYFGLLIGTVVTPFALPPGLVSWPVLLVLVVASAVWSYVFSTRQPPLAADPRRGGVYVAGLLVLMAALVHINPFYGFQAVAGYTQSFRFLSIGWAWAGAIVTAGMAAYAQTGGGLTPLTPGVVLGWLALAVFNVVLGGGGTYLGVVSTQQAHRRREVIVELNAANRQLSEALAENTELHGRLLVQAREAGILDERARLAREIHDTIAQGLTGVVAQLEAAAAVDDDPALRRRHSDTAMALARESLTEARRSVEALTPGQLDRAQLPDAIAEMAKRWGETAGVDLVLDTTGGPVPLLPELEIVLFRVAQEALVNVVKHADATRVGLTLSYMDDVVVLDVRDDGRGFAPEDVVTTGASGYGLAAMEQRVRRVSGTFTVESAPGEGTAVSASVPAIPAAEV